MTSLEDKHVRDVYMKIASHFSHTRREDRWTWIESFLDQYPEPNKVCDIGCGSGRNMRSNCFGVDNCPNFIKICQDKNLPVKLSEMINLELEDESFDAVICIAAFHHLDNEEKRLQALKEMKRILKPDGRILLSVWSINQPEKTKKQFAYGDNLVPWNNHGKIYERYYYIFRIDEIKNLFQKVGLTLIDNDNGHIWEYGNEIFILKIS